ncbi:hypothetical protein M7I_6367 [Glarea lozoyensis 74030]|uniref:Uncharacterized protein n=1 Tax=Glarea lozoyensis (strain ATCC 74030 / MF5533) TaxID=1104152 RepID=H0EUD3_GLAL7|nr:hypothetical protein M7I_6367 [Glarea lozoyensis 74030]
MQSSDMTLNVLLGTEIPLIRRQINHCSEDFIQCTSIMVPQHDVQIVNGLDFL